MKTSGITLSTESTDPHTGPHGATWIHVCTAGQVGAAGTRSKQGMEGAEVAKCRSLTLTVKLPFFMLLEFEPGWGRGWRFG